MKLFCLRIYNKLRHDVRRSSCLSQILRGHADPRGDLLLNLLIEINFLESQALQQTAES